jgi:uracil-DNA glycosylase
MFTREKILIRTNLPDDWQSGLTDLFDAPFYSKLEDAIAAERAKYADSIFPSEHEVFHALQLTPLRNVKVVILGQDPYPTRGHAHGLAFSVRPDVQPLPPSLKNIFKELVDDVGSSLPSTGDLSGWAEQGVLLLNTVLTVREGEANSHQKLGWELFTDGIIRTVNHQGSAPVVFVLWGKPAQKKESLINGAKHTVIKSPHPSPLSARTGFFGSKPFSKTNDALIAARRSPIQWA